MTAAPPFDLAPPGLVVNSLKGDPDEHRAGGWLAWDGRLEGLQAALIGVPFDGASVVRTGARHGPEAVRQSFMYYTTFSSRDARAMSGFRATDLGDVKVNLTDMAATRASIVRASRGLVERGIVPVSVGGDHWVAYPLIEGVTEALPGKKLGIIHFDAHHDLRKAHLGAESSGVPFRKALELPGTPIAGRNLVQIGMAEFANSPQLADYAREMGVTVFSQLAVAERGMDPIIAEALARAADGTDAIYVSVDIDAIDQSQAPGTAAPNPCGLDARDVMAALRRAAAHPKMVGFDLVEIAPAYDVHGLTGRTGAMLVLNVLYGLSTRPQ
jgi:formimidoylglutamase